MWACVYVWEWPPCMSPSSRSSSHLLLRNLKSISQLEWDNLHASCNLPQGDRMESVCMSVCVNVCIVCVCEGLTQLERAKWVSHDRDWQKKWGWEDGGKTAVAVFAVIWRHHTAGGQWFFISTNQREALFAVHNSTSQAPQFTPHHTQALSGKPNLQLLIW